MYPALRDDAKNHLRGELRVLAAYMLCPFHRRGKFFAQIARGDRVARQNRSKMSESGATDSLTQDVACMLQQPKSSSRARHYSVYFKR
jgi:hypothetical protein